MKPTLLVGMDWSSNLKAIDNDQQIPIAARAGESMHMSISRQCKVLTSFLFLSRGQHY